MLVVVVPFYATRLAVAHLSLAWMQSCTHVSTFAVAGSCGVECHPVISRCAVLLAEGVSGEPAVTFATFVAAGMIVYSTHILSSAHRNIHDAPIGAILKREMHALTCDRIRPQWPAPLRHAFVHRGVYT